MTEKNKIRGKKARESGQRFEVKVRKDLEKNGWVCDRWSNNVSFDYEADKFYNVKKGTTGLLIPAKSNRFNLRTCGFPDFIAISEKWHLIESLKPLENSIPKGLKVVFGIEVKSNGYLTKEEKEKCVWYLKNNIFSKILVASRGDKRGTIKYKEFEK